MDILLQSIAFIYLTLITIVFIKQKKINKIENFVYKGMIALNFIELAFDVAYHISNYYLPNSALTMILAKLFLCSSISWALGFSSYVFVLSSPKNTGEEATKADKKYFVDRFLIVVIFIILYDIAVFLLPLKINSYPDYIILDGWALWFMYAAVGSTTFLNLYTILKNKKSIKEKKFGIVWFFSFLLVLGLIIQFVFPYISVNITIATITTMLIYFTIENPDLGMINDLNIATQQAESANHAKSDFLSSMSHEIRTPLNAIIGFSKALAKEDISGSAKEEVKDILNASNNLLEIVNGILDISKIEANKIEIVNVDYSVRELINDLTSITNSRIGSKQIELKVELDQNVPPVLYGDSQRVKQILLNLLTNAVKYTKEGYILFQIGCEPSNDKLKMTFKVEDSGIGMTEEDQANLYTKFQRFDMEKNVNIAGTGLGMAITKGLVDLLEGQISVKSTYGEGTTFTVVLNQQVSTKRLEEVEAKILTDRVKPFDASGQKVMIVDDNKINLKVAEKLFAEYNLEIELVTSGQECIDKVAMKNDYNLIFLDIMMPQMKGPEVVEHLKKISGFETPVVALTADVITGLEDKYIEQGFDDCMSKPIIEEDLFYMLKKYLKNNDAPIEQIQIVETNNPETPKVLDTSILENAGVNVKASLVQLKDIDTYNNKLIEFYEQLDSNILSLFEFKNSNSLERYYACVGEMKKQAAKLGFTKFSEKLYEHELASKDDNSDFINNNFSKLKMESVSVNNTIKKYLGR